MGTRYRFISVSDQDKASATTRRLIYSHSARETHGAKRAKRARQYQDGLKGDNREQRAAAAVLEGLSGPSVYEHIEPRTTIALSTHEKFLLDYYVRVVVPRTARHCRLFEDTNIHIQQVLNYWVGFALAEKGLLAAAVLLSACRNLLRYEPHDTYLQSLIPRYRQQGLGALRTAIISHTASGAWMVAMALALAFDEVCSRTSIMLTITNSPLQVAAGECGLAQTHLSGVYALSKSRGGTSNLGLTRLLEQMYHQWVERRDLDEGIAVVLCDGVIHVRGRTE